MKKNRASIEFKQKFNIEQGKELITYVNNNSEDKLNVEITKFQVIKVKEL